MILFHIIWGGKSRGIDQLVRQLYVFPQEGIIPVNPNGETKEESLRGISGNLQSQGRSKWAPKGSNYEVPKGEFCTTEV